MLKLLKQTRIQILIIVVLTILAYSNIFQNEFVIDDKGFFLEWDLLSDVRNIPTFFTSEGLLEGNPPVGYRPVRTTLMAVAYQFFGQNPLGYHLLGIILHLATTILVYRISYIIYRKAGGLPFFTALLFALHPIHTEVVSFVSASFDLFGFIFFLGSFFLYIKSPLDKFSKTYLSALALAILAFFTYEATLSLTLAVVLYDLIFRKLNLKNYIPFFFAGSFYFFVRTFLVHITPKGLSYFEIGPYFNILLSIKAFARYIYLLFVPTNLSLDPYLGEGLYSHSTSAEITENLRRNSILDLSNLLPILLVGLLIFLTFKFWRRYKLISFAIGWIFITFLPTSSIVLTGVIMQERYIYLASFGFCLIFGYIFYLLHLRLQSGIGKLILAGIIISISIFYMYQTHLRNKDWKNDITLNKSVSESSPKNFLQHYNLGVRYSEKGMYNEALQAYLKTISVRPDFWAAHFNLGNIYYHFGYKEQARVEYEITLRLNPGYLPAKELLESLSTNK